MTLAMRTSILTRDQREVLGRLGAGHRLVRVSLHWWEFRTKPERQVWHERVQQMIVLGFARVSATTRTGPLTGLWQRVEITDAGRTAIESAGGES